QLGRCQFRRLRHRDASADIARLAADLAEGDAELAVALQRGPYGVPDVVCPYPGMVAFGPGDAPFFQGREKLVATLLSRLGLQIRRGGGPLVVVGPSGVGKSSLLRAGLLPALAAGDLPIEGSASWPRMYLRPGPDPLAELAAQVAMLGGREEELPAATRAPPAGLRQALRRVAGSATEDPMSGIPSAAAPVPAGGRQDRRVVVVVDQIEELFTQGAAETDRLAMLRALVCASESTGSTGSEPNGTDPAPAVVLLGLRADFYAHCARGAELVPYLENSQVVVTAMNAAERR